MISKVLSLIVYVSGNRRSEVKLCQLGKSLKHCPCLLLCFQVVLAYRNQGRILPDGQTVDLSKPERFKLAMGCHAQKEMCAKDACSRREDLCLLKCPSSSHVSETPPPSYLIRTLFTFPSRRRRFRAQALPPSFIDQ